MKIGDTELLTLQQVSERSGISHETLQKQAKSGILRAEKLGGRWVVTAQEYERYRQEHKGKRGFASPLHPLHGKSGRGKRRETS